MLNKKLYELCKQHNLTTKYNRDYNKSEMLNCVCGIYIESLLNSKYELTNEQRNLLMSLLNNLLVL